MLSKNELTNGLKMIGRGSFTRCYQKNETRVVLQTICPIKECMSFGWFPESDLFPVVEQIDLGLYEMELYPKVRSLKANLDPDQYVIYKELRRIQDLVHTFKSSNWKPSDSFNDVHAAFDDIKDPELRETMKEALDACANYGTDIGFEISPRNVAAKNGKLILLDVFFSIGKLQELNKIRNTRRAGRQSC